MDSIALIRMLSIPSTRHMWKCLRFKFDLNEEINHKVVKGFESGHEELKRMIDQILEKSI